MAMTGLSNKITEAGDDGMMPKKRDSCEKMRRAAVDQGARPVRRG
jgi:hypothetical protein